MLIVEDGTGLPNSDSYVSLVEAEAYFAAYPNDNWSGEDVDKEVALRRASLDLDLVFGQQFIGVQASQDQSLLFPRLGDTSINNRVKRATCELAALIIGGYTATNASDDLGVTEFSFKVEGVYGETVKYASGKAGLPELNRVRLLLGSLLRPASTDSSFTVLNIVRG